MRKILLIARREFLLTVGQPVYIVSLIIPPFLLAVIGMMIALLARPGADNREGTRIGVLDRVNVIDLEQIKAVKAEGRTAISNLDMAQNTVFLLYKDLAEALRDLRDAKLEILYVIETGYIQTGEVKAYTRKVGFFSGAENVGVSSLQRLLRASLLRAMDKSPDNDAELTLNRILDPAEAKKFTLRAGGGLHLAGNQAEEAARLFIPLTFAFLLTASVFVSSGYLLRSMVEEKSNRTIEILLSSVNPNQTLWGKLLGLGGAGFLQITFYLVISGLAILSLGSQLNIPLTNLAVSLVYCLIGYLLYAGLLIGAGIIAGGASESKQIASILALIAISPLILIGVLMNASDGTLARSLTYFPLTSPVTMILRLSLTVVPIREQVASLAVLATSACLSMLGAAKLFRTAALMYGKPFNLREIVRWLS